MGESQVFLMCSVTNCMSNILDTNVWATKRAWNSEQLQKGARVLVGITKLVPLVHVFELLLQKIVLKN